MPSIGGVALSPDKKHLVVMLTLNTPAPHDTTGQLVRSIYAMPAGVLP